MQDGNESDGIEPILSVDSSFLGLNSNLWRLAIVLGAGQFSLGLWQWEFSIFLARIIEPWQMGIVFAFATFAGLLGGLISGSLTDFIGRKWALASTFIPVMIGLVSISYLPIWPLLLAQYSLIWFGISSVRVIARAIPADEITADEGRNPAQKMMMVGTLSWLVDGLSPLLGTYLMSIGYTSSDLQRIATIGAVIAFIAAVVFVKETLGPSVMEKARAGPKFPIHRLGRSFWMLAAAMIGFYFSWYLAIPYIGNLAVDPQPFGWGVDPIIYGYTWSAFSLTSALLMYVSSKLADRNLKGAYLFAVISTGIVFIMFSIGSGVPLMFLINIIWAPPFIIWIGTERSLLVLIVPEEVKGRALGTWEFFMGFVGIIATMVGAILWDVTGSLRTVWGVAGIGMLATVLVFAPVLWHIKVQNSSMDESQ
ncbi:MAG: hypothetical protein RTU30_11585 [Candidatus Thorarchaeota archaeon]